MKKAHLLVLALTLFISAFSQTTVLEKFSVEKGDDELYGVKDDKGKIIVPATFPSLRIIDDYVIASDGISKVSYFNNQGKLLAKYCEIKPFKYGVSLVSVCVGEYGFDGLINKQGKVILAPNKYNKISDFNQYGLSEVLIFGKNDVLKYGVIDTLGRTIAICKYDALDMRIGNGLFAFKLNGKWGYMNLKGQEVIKATYDTQSPFKDGKARVFFNKPEVRQLYIDTTGKVIN